MKKKVVKPLTKSKNKQGYVSIKVVIPSEWAKDMQLLEEDSQVEMIYDKETKTIFVKKED